MVRLRSIAIVGASLAGLRAAEALRREGFDGRLVLVGAEPHLPYDRPPLSKEVLSGKRSPDDVGLTKPDRFDALELDLRLGCRATALDLDDRAIRVESIRTGSPERIEFDGLVVATGASPRRLPGTKHLAYVEENAAAADLSISEGDLKRAGDIINPTTVSGDRYSKSQMISLDPEED